MTNYKQAIVVRKDLNLSPGKIAAQVAHAAIGAYKKSSSKDVKRWEKQGSKKVVLKAKDVKQLVHLKGDAEKTGLNSYLVTDAGRTEIPSGTKTALAIGPDEEDKIDKITGSLPLLK